MAYNFLGLANDVGERLGEVALTSGNFSTAVGAYALIRQAVNSSIRHINQENFQWPFNHVLQTDTLTAGQMRWPYPATAKTIDYNSFRVKRDATIGNSTQKIKRVDYEEYLDTYLDDEYNTTNTGIRSIPRYVAQAPSSEFVIAPSPDEAYELDYEFYSLPVELSAYDDVPSAPEDFRHVIVDGAVYYLYLFRKDFDAADRIFQMFKQGIKTQRTLYSNRYEYLRDTRVANGGSYPNAVATN